MQLTTAPLAAPARPRIWSADLVEHCAAIAQEAVDCSGDAAHWQIALDIFDEMLDGTRPEDELDCWLDQYTAGSDVYADELSRARSPSTRFRTRSMESECAREAA